MVGFPWGFSLFQKFNMRPKPILLLDEEGMMLREIEEGEFDEWNTKSESNTEKPQVWQTNWPKQ